MADKIIGNPCCEWDHEETDEPCPQRIARAFLGQAGALNALLDVDREWIQAHDYDVVAVIAEDLSETLTNG